MRNSLLFRKLAIAGIAICSSQIAIATDNTTDVVVVGMTLFSAGYSFLNDDKEGLMQFAQAAFIDMSATYFLKYVVKEQRPDHSDTKSFPSGHVSLAATDATYMGYRYGWEWGLGMGIITSVVGAERISKKKHDLVDVIAGAALGYLSAAFVTTNQHSNLKLMPGYSPDDKGYMLNFQYTF
jgi:membrane-associated phospholipid phosphatase